MRNNGDLVRTHEILEKVIQERGQLRGHIITLHLEQKRLLDLIQDLLAEVQASTDRPSLAQRAAVAVLERSGA